MGWEWQEPYKAALRERDPAKLPGLLVLAEKAILGRMREVPDSSEELPEGKALREALNSLYALRPREYHAPGNVADDDEYGEVRERWRPIAAGVALALAIGTGGLVWRRASANEAQRSRAEKAAEALISSSPRVIVERTDEPPPGHLDVQTGSQFSPAGHGASGPALREASGDSGREEKNESNTKRAGGELAQAQAKPPAQEAHGNGVVTPPSNADQADAAKSSANTVTKQATPELSSSQERSSSEQLAQATSDGTPLAANRLQNYSGVLPDSNEPAPREEGLPRGSVSVSAGTYPSIRLPAGLKLEQPRSAASLQIGEPISRADPVYPEDAERQHIQGSVKLRAIIGTDGGVRNVEIIEGPPLLARAAVEAIRHWQYQPTLVGNQPVEVAEEITITFRLADAVAKVN